MTSSCGGSDQLHRTLVRSFSCGSLVNGDRGVPVPEPSSLISIIGILVVTVVLSLVSPAGRVKSTQSSVRRRATTVLDESEDAEARTDARADTSAISRGFGDTSGCGPRGMRTPSCGR